MTAIQHKSSLKLCPLSCLLVIRDSTQADSSERESGEEGNGAGRIRENDTAPLFESARHVLNTMALLI
jgi:hypothetical protein